MQATQHMKSNNDKGKVPSWIRVKQQETRNQSKGWNDQAPVLLLALLRPLLRRWLLLWLLLLLLLLWLPRPAVVHALASAPGHACAHAPAQAHWRT
jgi:hypothetical protein